MANDQQPFDPNAQQWYVAGTPATNSLPPDGEEKRKKWIRIGVASGVGVLVLVIVIFFVRNALESRQTAQAVRANKQTEALDACDTTKNPEKCKTSVPADLAQAEGDTSYCGGLSGSEKDTCLNAAALTAKDVAICQGMSDTQTALTCQDAVAYLVGKEQGESEETCALYATEATKETCIQNVLFAKARTGDCSDARLSQELCDEARFMQQAVDARDPALCDQIDTNEGEAACREMVGPGDADHDGLDATEESQVGTSDHLVDTDGDGLSDYEEVKTYFTNPAKSDTDGDGYTDGTEVAHGYDPLH